MKKITIIFTTLFVASLVSACGSDGGNSGSSENDNSSSSSSSNSNSNSIIGLWLSEGDEDLNPNRIFSIDENKIFEFYVCRFGEYEPSGAAPTQINEDNTDELPIGDSKLELEYNNVNGNLVVTSNYYDADGNLYNTNESLPYERLSSVPVECPLRNIELAISGVSPTTVSGDASATIQFDYTYRYLSSDDANGIAEVYIFKGTEPGQTISYDLGWQADKGGNISEGSSSIVINREDLIGATGIQIAFGLSSSDMVETNIHLSDYKKITIAN